MREILFRGKNIETGEWEYGLLIIGNQYHDYSGNKVFYIYSNDTPIRETGFIGNYWGTQVDPKTVGQFTGLYDINGKKIFEGDILSFVHSVHNYRETPEVVEWDRQLSAFITKYRNDYWDYLGFDTYEIIGNIHDNPELVEVK